MKSKYYVRTQPEGSKEVKREGIDAVVYVGPGLYAKGYRGKSDKSAFYFKFRTQEEMDSHINSFFDAIAFRNKDKEARRAKKAAFKTTLKVGDILTSSWGYEQTNVDFYQVVEVSPTEKTVKIREINKESKGNGLFMQGTCVPVPNAFISAPMLKKVQPDNYINLNSFSCAHLWGGEPVSYSSYA